MLIDEFRRERDARTANEEKEIKVRVSRDYHVRLHTMKVVNRANISETIKVALEQYFVEIGMMTHGDTRNRAMPETVLTLDR